MKKITALLGVLAVMLLAGKVMAAFTNPDSLLIRVTPIGTRSVAVQAQYDFGPQDLASSTMSLTAIPVVNDGQVPNTYSLQLNLTGTSWQSDVAVGADAFNLSARFNSTAPAIAAITDQVLTGSAKVANGTIFAGDQTGVGVPPTGANSINMWLKLDMPSSSIPTTEQTFNVIVLAQ